MIELDALVQVVQENGGGMEFDEFKSAARAAGANPNFWLKAKHAGLLKTEILEDGRLWISLPETEGA